MEHADILHRCFRCGYCKLPANYVDFNCPPYLKYRFESFSPGGRMWLLRAWNEGKLQPGRRFQDILFTCTACGNCVEHCTFPKFKDRILMAFTAGKEELVNSGTVPSPVRDCLTRFQTHGNPYGLSPGKRAKWNQERILEPYDGHEYLFFAGDVGSYDTRGRAIARSVARLLLRQGLSMGVLETGEVSDGNEVLAMGERDLFQHLAEKNINNFNAAGVEKIIALSPHGFNALKNEYPQFGGTYSVSHYSQVLTSLCETLVFQPDLPPLRVTYHDSCYLGRHNHEYWSVRQLLQVMPGIETLEMDRNLQNALCCGGGGGNLYTDMLGSGPGSAARARIREAADSGAQVLVTACPTCAVMFDDAIKQENLTDRLAVREISELINERLTGHTDL